MTAARTQDHEKRIFITGGASGLGRALAERYAREGWRVCIGDVNELRGLETLSLLRDLGAEAHFAKCNVTEEVQIQAVAEWLYRNWGGVDVVVNNAGVAIAGGIDEVPLKDWHWAVDINLLGVVRGCKVFTPMFRAQGHGHFVNVASMAGLIHAPMMSAYNATKAAVVALSETLRVELADAGIGVSVVCPAFFRTNLAESLRAGNPHVQQMTQKLVGKAEVGADEIAGQVFRAVARGEFHILTHARERLLWRLKRLLPFAAYLAILVRGTRRMMAPRAPDARGSTASS